MANLHEDTKKIITSILTSSPNKFNVLQLKRDYYDMIGEDIPYRKLGYSNLDDYLYSIPDTLIIHGKGPNALVEVIVTKKSAHINKLITKQKKTTKKRSRLYSRNTRNHSYYEQLRHNTNRLERLQIQDSHRDKEEIKDTSTVIEPDAIARPSCSNHVEMENPNSSKSSDDMFNFENESNMEINNYIFKQIQSRKNIRVPINVQENLKKLVIEYKDGIWCAEIPTIYKERYKETLNYSDYGYKSLIQLCTDLGDCFKFLRPGKGDYKVYDKSASVRHYTAENIKSNVILQDEYIAPCNTEPALPDMTDMLQEHFLHQCPKDIVKYGEILERQDISNLKLLDYVNVNVAEIYDPSKFWVIINNDDCLHKLDTLMDDIQLFYTNDKYHMPQYMIKMGMYCAAVIYNEYHRAIIVSVVHFETNNVKLFFIDYGTVAMVPSNNLYFLHRDFFQLPQQAIRARLSGIYPPTTDTQWTRAASARFMELVKNKDLVAQILRIEENKHILEIILADTTTPVDIFINDVLVREGYALFTNQEQTIIKQQRKPIVKYIHLFPTFDEIELGKVPSATEMTLLTSMESHLIYPHYYHTHNKNITIETEDDSFHVRRPKDIMLNSPSNNDYSNNEVTRGDSQENMSVASSELNHASTRDDTFTIKNLDNNQLEMQSSNVVVSTPIIQERNLQNNVQINQPEHTNQRTIRPPPGFHLNPESPQFFPKIRPYIPMYDYYGPASFPQNVPYRLPQPYTPYAVYPTPNLHSFQLPNFIQNNHLNNLNESFNQININRNLQETIIKQTPIDVPKLINKFLTIHDFRDDILHLIRYKNEKYLFLNEVINKFICEDITVLRIRRILAKGIYVRLLSLDAKTNSELKMEMIRNKLLDENEIIIHLVLAADVPKLMHELNKEFVDVEEYETFLLNAK